MNTGAADSNTMNVEAPLPPIKQANKPALGRVVNVALGRLQPRGVGRGASRNFPTLPHVDQRNISDASAQVAAVKVIPTATDWQAAETITAEQRYATDQLMLALRVASAKLSYAQRQVRELESRDGARWK